MPLLLFDSEAKEMVSGVGGRDGAVNTDTFAVAINGIELLEGKGRLAPGFQIGGMLELKINLGIGRADQVDREDRFRSFGDGDTWSAVAGGRYRIESERV